MFLPARLRSGPITGRKMQRRALACSLRLSVWDLLQTFASHVEPRQRCLRRNIPTEMAGIRFVPSRVWWSLSVLLGSLITVLSGQNGFAGPRICRERLKAYAQDPRCLKTTFVQARIRSVSLTPSVPISLLRCIHGRHSQVPYPSTWASTGGGISNAHERGGLGNQPEKPGGNRYGISRKVEAEGARAVPG